MSFSSLVTEVAIGGEMIRLQMQDQTPIVEFQNESIKHLWILCQKCQFLNDPVYLKEFVQISNFLWKGMSFQVIDRIEEYQTFYYNQIELEKKYPTDVFPFRLTDYKIFDLSVMEDPVIIKGHLHFFVYQVSTALPYRVSCPFPYQSSSTVVHYQILPLLS